MACEYSVVPISPDCPVCFTPPLENVQPTQMQLSPISFLPNEVLIDIFHHGLDEIPRLAPALPLPIAMASVCKGWRAVVLRTPELWTRVFVTSATPTDHLQTCLERSRDLEIDANFCHWPAPKDANEFNASVESIVDTLCRHAHRLRSLSLWDVSDTFVCTVTGGLLNSNTPRLTNVSVKAHHTAYDHYYRLDKLYLLSFLGGGAPLLTHLEVDHFPIETFQLGDNLPFNARNLVSLTLRTRECSTQGFSLPPYLIKFPALCALLRSTLNLNTLALYGPIIEPDEGFPIRPPGVTLSSLKTLIVHRRDPGVRYHCELLSVLTAPTLEHFEIPWHDDLTVELPHVDRTLQYLFDENGQPRFASVKSLYLHDSVVRWMMPTRSLMKAFPNLEEVMLGGADVAKFATTLRGCVRPCSVNCARPTRAGRWVSRGSETEGVLTEGSWEMVRRVVLKEPEMAQWKGWVRGFSKWLAAGGHVEKIRIEIRDGALREDREIWAFKRGLERLGKYAQVVAV